MKLAIEQIARERIDLLVRKYTSGEWTTVEADRLEELNKEMNRLAPRVTPDMLEIQSALMHNLQNTKE